MPALKIGIIGGSSLFHSTRFSTMETKVVETEHGDVLAYTGVWGNTTHEILFIQRHHADAKNHAYNQPANINFRAILTALKQENVDCVIGIYSVGSMRLDIPIGQLIIPDDYFNPFHILNISAGYEAHVVPHITESLRQHLIQLLKSAQMNPRDGGVYVQTSGPRFETKSEIRFFATCGELIGMTGAHEAGLANEVKLPFAMVSVVDNMANGLGEKLTLEDFKLAQKENYKIMENAVIYILDNFDGSVVAAAPEGGAE
ncbi:Aste57867_24174 [Aphanomyces stellatus]|uniref:Aste57867_24174 protein n=1 Tax=Aphanomyces stellatus TaxID=120398 RepID=A0A485LQT6_9STRA|nr:hypothetical protein As57867_024100 [Aphanomyces stellatus]VFU00816.1 Aste57867_24174 [Aphanomyces stellatus]